jgi:hypothetical protein
MFAIGWAEKVVFVLNVPGFEPKPYLSWVAACLNTSITVCTFTR